jgi:hypothetical protein
MRLVLDLHFVNPSARVAAMVDKLHKLLAGGGGRNTVNAGYNDTLRRVFTIVIPRISL